MQGYGITYRYKFRIHNVGKSRKLTYHVILNRDYNIKYTLNGQSATAELYKESEDSSYEADVFNIDLPTGENELVIETTEFAGASAANKSSFTIN